MKDFLKFLVLIFFAILIVIVYQLSKKGITEDAKLKKERLLQERETRVRETQQKEKLRNYLERKFKTWLYPGYTILIMTFLVISAIFTLIFCSELNTEKLFVGAGVTEAVLIAITAFVYQKTYEFKFILNQFSPFLRKKIFGENINIDSEIELGYVRINEIDDEIKQLDKLIFA